MGVVPRLITACTVLVFALVAQTTNVPSASATAPLSPFEWSISGPGQVRFNGVATSKNGAISFGVPDPAPANPPAKGYRSSDGGASWTVMSGMEARYWRFVDTSADGQVVFASGSAVVNSASQSAVFSSVDSGITWTTAIPYDPSAPNTVHGDVSVSDDGQKVVVGTNIGLLYSSDRGATWTSIWSGNTRGVAISGDGSVIMVQEANVGIHRTLDHGASWTTVNNSAFNWSNIELSTDGNSALAVASRGGLTGGAFFTHNGGTTWIDAALNSTFVDNQLATGAMSPDGNTMIASSYYSTPRASTDGGLTWSVLPTAVSNVIPNGWTGFAVSNPNPATPANTVESMIFAVTENYRIAHFGFGPPPAISSVYPARVSVTGGRTVILNGANLTGASAVTFGGVAASSFNVVSANRIDAVVPAHVAGVVDVLVTTPRGTSAAWPGSQITYVDYPAPTITRVSPGSLAAATISVVTITGTNFVDVETVTVDGLQTDWSMVDATTIIAITPPHPVGSGALVVTTFGGSTSANISWDAANNPPDRGYSVISSFDPVGVDGLEVRALDSMPDGRLVAAGVFSNAGGEATADCVATWDGDRWSGLGSDGSGNGVIDCSPGVIETLDVGVDGSVIIQGSFRISGSPTEYVVALWDGSRWTGLLRTDQLAGYITRPIVVSASQAYIAGDFVDVNGDPDADYLVMWNGSSWSTPGSAGAPVFNNTVTGLAWSPSGNLYVVGYFTDAGGLAGADNVAMWNGSTWAPIGVDGSATSLFGGFVPEWLYLDRSFGRDTLVVSVRDEQGVPVARLYRFDEGAWSPIVADSWLSTVGVFGVASNGTVLASGIIDDSVTRSLGSVAVLKSGRWSAFSLVTSVSDGSVGVSAVHLMPDGRLVVGQNLRTSTGWTARIIVFDVLDDFRPVPPSTAVTPTLPATGSKPPVLPAILVTGLGVLLRMLTRRRRFRVS